MNLEILKIASNTDNHKVLNNHTHHSKLKNRICGDEMQVSLKVVKNNIVDFGYQCESCIYCQASVSLLSRNSLNKKVLQIKVLLKMAENFFENKDNSFSKKEIVLSIFSFILSGALSYSCTNNPALKLSKILPPSFP